jgi:hypothetical protein
VAVEVTSASGDLNPSLVQQRLEQVAGVSRVLPRETKDGKVHMTVESLEGRHIRPGLARAVVEAGWELNELHAVGLSLEEIFLQLTSSTKEGEPETTPTVSAAGVPVGEAR